MSGRLGRAKATTWDRGYLSQFDDTRPLCVHLTERQIQALLTATFPMAWKTRWFGAGSISPKLFAANVADNLMLAGKCKPRIIYNHPPFDWRRNPDGSITIDIHEDCDMPIYVNFYEGCCGDDGKPVAPPVNPVGLPPSQRATKCDAVTQVVPYFVNSIADWLRDVDIAVTNGASLIDAVLGSATEFLDPTNLTSNAVEIITEYLSTSLDAFIAAFEDQDLVLKTQTNWWGRVEPGTSYDAFTRTDIVTLGASLPVIWGNAFVTGTVSPRAIGELLSRVLSVNEFNAQVIIAQGKAEQGLCEYLAAENGESYTPPPAPFPPPNVTIETDDFVYTRVETERSVVLGTTIQFDGTGFAGIAYRVTAANVGNPGTAVFLNFDTDIGGVNCQANDSQGSGVFPSVGSQYVRGIGDAAIALDATNSGDALISWIGGLTFNDLCGSAVNTDPFDGSQGFQPTQNWAFEVELWVITYA